MTAPAFLPVRPSLESIRKQAKKLARDIAAGNAQAVARARVQLPDCELPLSQRDAQLVLAREYGFAGWQQLKNEVLKRSDSALAWAVPQAGRAIHDNDLERLKQLLTEYPALLAWRDEAGGGLLSKAASSFGDSFDAFREQVFTRPACAELLIDAGAVVDSSVWEGVIGSRARGMLQLLWGRGVLPRTLKILAALGDLDVVIACFDDSGALRAGSGSPDDLASVSAAFTCACRFQHRSIASFLLERCIALDDELGRRIDGWQGRPAFIEYLVEHPQQFGSPWQTLVVNEARRAIHENDLPAFVRWLQGESWLLGEPCVHLQVELIENATLNDRGAFITSLLELDPAVLRSRPPPRSSAMAFAFEYAHAHLVPLLMRIWPLPDDLPHAAGMGDFERVKRWFDDTGQPVLGNLNEHYPVNNAPKREHMHWGAGTVQQVLDVALAWACLNRQLDIAQFLLRHGADINTTWSSHEPASILHELVFHDNYEAMRFLIDHGIDMTTRDHRWNATAEGWAYHAAKNEEMAQFLAAAQQQRQKG